MKKVLVAIDFMDATDVLIDKAVQLIGEEDAELVLLHVCKPLDKMMVKAYIERQDGKCCGSIVRYDAVRDDVAHELRYERKMICDLVSRVEKDSVTARGVLIHGKLCNSIIHEVQHLDVDMVVMGSHYHSILHQLIFGSLRAKLEKKLSIPVHVIPVDRKEGYKQIRGLRYTS